VETGTGRRQEGKKVERTEAEKEDYHRKQGLCIEEKIKMKLRREWLYIHRHNVGSWSDGRMAREVGTYVQREKKDGRKTNAAGCYTGTHCAQGFYQSQEVTCGCR
jgi:hypothetical protein